MSIIETLPVDSDLPVDPPEAYVEAMVKRAGTSFFWAMRSLKLERRRGVFAVYGFCRDVDDIADGDLPLYQKRALLELWREEIKAIYNGTQSHPIGQALVEPVKTYGLKEADFVAVIDGMEMDAYPRVRIQDMAELELYCDRVACAVGRLCVPIFGLQEDEGVRLSGSLGAALQLTNILRDVIEDAGIDRVYLPAELLAHADVKSDQITDVLAAPGLADLCAGLAERAEQFFENAKAIIQNADSKAARPAHMMLQVYYRVFQKLQNRGWHDLEKDVRPSKLEKIAIALRYGIFG